MAPHDMISNTSGTSRRGFLAGSAGLVIALTLPVKGRAQQAGGTAQFEPNAFIRVAPDNTVTVLSRNIEFGQGPWTGHATVIADEMDADWSQIRVQHSPSAPDNPAIGMQTTGGSGSIRSGFELMRKAGATARAMLVDAAAETWGVPAGEITVSRGVVSHAASGQSATFGVLADAAARQTPPEDPPLKTPDQFTLIGTDVPKIDTMAKTTGAARFTIDIYRDNMLTAVVAHAPKFGAVPASFNADAALAVKGVVGVEQISSGVAVFAENTHAALKGRKALTIDWDDGEVDTQSSDAVLAGLMEQARQRGAVAFEEGNVDEALIGAQTVLEAEYSFPYLVHAPMEPLDGVIERREDGGVEVWMGAQFATMDHPAIARVCGLENAQVTLNVELAGGSFGRRATADSHFAVELAEAFMAMGGERPVKLIWTREDDIRGGYYRPVTVHRLRGGLDAEGNIVGWDHVVAGQSFIAGTPFANFMMQEGVDRTMVEGASRIPYTLPARHTSAHYITKPVPTLWWRSVGHTHTAYAVEAFIDQLLAEAGADAVEGRLALMGEAPRLAETLRVAAEMAGWGSRTLPAGHALGVASAESFSTYVSEVAEVSIEDGLPKVHKVWCAVDCGIAVNPNVIRAQMEGGIGYGLGAILFNELKIEDGGEVVQSNFHDYRSLRMAEMPEIEVTIIKSDAPPTGVGEPGVPPVGPAVANAVRRLTGATPSRLPMMNVTSA